MLLKTKKQENTKALGNEVQGANKQLLEMKFMNQVKTPMFKSDIGYYFKIPYMKHCHARRLKHVDVGKIMGVLGSHNQFNKTLQIVYNQFDIISSLSAQVDAELALGAKSSTNSTSNIKCNYFLTYFQTKFDLNYGCFLFHEPIILTLDEWIKQGNLSYPEKLELIKQILEIMSFLQQLKICHRCITSYSFVVCYQKPSMYDPEADFMETKKNFKFDKNKHRLKITGFYQQIIIKNKTKKNSSYPSPIFENLYTDPNSNNFQTPQYDSDLWSVLLLFYEILTGKIPNLSKTDDIKKGLQLMLPWQKDMFQYYFKGTKQVRITLKDLKMRFKNELLSLQSTCKILKAKSLEMQISSEFQSIREWKKKNAEARNRVYSYSQQ